jgi:hypothetical protein
MTYISFIGQEIVAIYGFDRGSYLSATLFSYSE